MILALLIGCLTQDRFAVEWTQTLCAAADECGVEIDGFNCDGRAHFPDCIEWDADAAAVCLDAMADACGSLPDECIQFRICPE